MHIEFIGKRQVGAGTGGSMDLREDRGNTAQRPAMGLLELSRVAEELARLLKEHVQPAPPRPQPRPQAPEPQPELITAPLVRLIIALRRMRRDYFPWIPGEPAWSMMLELLAARLEGRRLSQTNLGANAGVPETTALRVTKALLSEGVFISESDPCDRRLILIALSDDAADRMRAYLTEAIAAGPFPA